MQDSGIYLSFALESLHFLLRSSLHGVVENMSVGKIREITMMMIPSGREMTGMTNIGAVDKVELGL